MKSIIFDLDGTLANCEKRKRFITNGRRQWNKFNDPDECAKDLPIVSTINLAKLYKAAGYRICVFTGRDEIARGVTLQWFIENEVPVDLLVMRPQRSNKADTYWKTLWLEEHFPDGYDDIEAVYEDRDKVVKMYRDLGMRCFQVDYGDF